MFGINSDSLYNMDTYIHRLLYYDSLMTLVTTGGRWELLGRKEGFPRSRPAVLLSISGVCVADMRGTVQYHYYGGTTPV